MIDTEAVDAEFVGKFYLTYDILRLVETVIVLVRRNSRLHVTFVLGLSLFNGHPVSKAFSPPLVVLRHAVILRQIISYDLGFRHDITTLL